MINDNADHNADHDADHDADHNADHDTTQRAGARRGAAAEMEAIDESPVRSGAGRFVPGGQEGEEFAARLGRMRRGDMDSRDVFDDGGRRSTPTDAYQALPEFDAVALDGGLDQSFGTWTTVGTTRRDVGAASVDRPGDDEFITDGTETGLGRAQTASAPPPPPPPPPPPADEQEGAPVEKPEIWKRRDGDATDPADEEPVDPRPEPKPPEERPKLFDKDEPDDGPTENGPTGGPTFKPEIFTERLHDTDEDGDGVPDGRFDPTDPIGTDGNDLGDIVGAGPPVGETVAATPQQSSGTIGRPDDDGLWIDLYAGGVHDVPERQPVVDRSSMMDSDTSGYVGETEANAHAGTVADHDVAVGLGDDITTLPAQAAGDDMQPQRLVDRRTADDKETFEASAPAPATEPTDVPATESAAAPTPTVVVADAVADAVSVAEVETAIPAIEPVAPEPDPVAMEPEPVAPEPEPVVDDGLDDQL